MGIFSRALLDLTWYLGLAAQQCPQRAFQFLWFRCAFIIFSGIHYRNTQVNRRWQVRINMISRISASSLACALTVRIVEIGFIIGNRLSTTHLTVFSRNKTYRLKMCLPAQMTSRPGLFWFSWKMYSNKILKWCYAEKKLLFSTTTNHEIFIMEYSPSHDGRNTYKFKGFFMRSAS